MLIVYILSRCPFFMEQLTQQIRTADNVNILKSLLKTHLFNAVYSWLYLI